MDGTHTLAARMLTLQVLPAGSERYFDGSRPILIGRDAAADVVVLDTAASAQHAVLRMDLGGAWVFEDRSSNGTYLDGSRVERMTVDRPVTLSIGASNEGARIRLVPPALFGTPDPHTPDPPRYAPGESAPGIFTGTYRMSGSRIRIGRAVDNDIVVDDLLASRHHAELRTASAGGLEIVDLDSHNGTFVNGRLVTGRSRVSEGSLVAVGHTLLRLRRGTLEEYADTGVAAFAALDLTVKAGRRRLLEGVSFSLEGGQFLAVLGPTGAGKSTLLKALTGARPADQGAVLYNGRDVYGAFAELRNRIGYVPQDDTLHPQLTVRSALDYAARLRFPPDVPRSERSARVEEVMRELGLEHRAKLRVERLSGGQRKRTSVAIELLTRPSLLILDEPTSGLDPGHEKSVMELLRELADGGRTVLTATHSIQSLDLYDRLLFLAPGGQTAYFGPPAEALPFFEQPGYPEVFQRLDRSAPDKAREAFAGTAIEGRYVTEPLEAQRGRLNLATAQPHAPSRSPHGIRQLVALVRRHTTLIAADRRNTLMLMAQAPILGLLMLGSFGTGNLKPGTLAAAQNSTTVLLSLILAASYLGASNAIREIVKERAILARERPVGLSTWAYVLSKALVLGVITVIESFVLTYIALSRQGGLTRGVVLHNGRIELALVVSLTGLAAMALGLLVSARASNADKVLTILPIILFAQFVLSGSAFPVRSTPGLNEVAYLSGARWGYSAAASTASLDQLIVDGCNSAETVGPMPNGGTGMVNCDPAHAPTVMAWSQDMAMLGALTIVSLAGAGLTVRKIGRPARR